MSSSPIVASNRVEGTSVFDAAGQKLGSIDTLMIDKLSGHVRYAVLEFGGFLGVGTDRYPLPWAMLKYDSGRDGYVVALDKSKLENAPKYTDARLPAFDKEYDGRINAFYAMF